MWAMKIRSSKQSHSCFSIDEPIFCLSCCHGRYVNLDFRVAFSELGKDPVDKKIDIVKFRQNDQGLRLNLTHLF